MLNVFGLEYSYGQKKRLRKVSFALKRGETKGVFGSNGSGKSTLLKMLSGVLPIKTGAITFLDQNAVSLQGFIKHELRKYIGVLFQSTSSDEKLSSLANLDFFAQLMGQTKSAARQKSLEFLELASLLDRAHDPVKKLSGGMRRRLELYRTFIHEPQLLLLDEPTAGLDVKETDKFLSFLHAYQTRTGAAVLMVAHDPNDLLGCDQIIMMKEGVVLCEDSPKSLLGGLNYVNGTATFFPSFTPDLHALPWFNARVNETKELIHAKIKKTDLPVFLQNPLWQSPYVKELSIEAPNLADVYEELVVDSSRWLP